MSLLNGLTFASLTGNCFDADKTNKQWLQKATYPYEKVNAYSDKLDESTTKMKQNKKNEKIEKSSDSMDNSIGMQCMQHRFNYKINFSFIFLAHRINGLIIHTINRCHYVKR